MKKRFFVLTIALIVSMLCITLVACNGKDKDNTPDTPSGHDHTYATEWSKDGESHWHACTGEDCTEISDKASHSFTTGRDATSHWQECACGYKKDVTAHTFETAHNDTKHWQECSECEYAQENEENHSFTPNHDETNHWQECTCGYIKDQEAHDLTVAELNTDNHVLGCDCGYRSNKIPHTYETDSQTECDGCTHERDNTSLAFKSGTYTLTYNGQAQAFNKADWVDTNVSLDDVIVEYSTSKTEPVWTTSAPKDAGTYYIKLSVVANDSHTACSISGLEDENAFTITAKKLSVSDLVLTIKTTDLTSITGFTTMYLTSDDIAGIESSDSLKVSVAWKSGSTFISGEEYTVEVKNLLSSSHAEKYVTIEALDNNNYTLDNTTTGKMYVVNNVIEASEDGTFSLNSESFSVVKTKYYAMEITDEMITEYGDAISGGFTFGDVTVKDLTITISVYNANGSIENSATAGTGKLYCEDLTAGKYIIKVEANKSFTASFNITFA